MPFLSTEGLSLVDIAMLVVIVLGLPMEALLNLKKGREELASNAPGVRVKHYTQTILLLWAISLPVIVLWAVSGRDWAEIGFQIPTGPYAMYGLGLAGLITMFFLYQHAVVSKSREAREKYRDGILGNARIANFMPHTDDERQLFNLMGVTAGITEEIVFRGYLIWVLSLFAPLWVAALIALALFTVLHLYQGADQLPSVFGMGGLLTLVFVLTGSLWPAIALHIFVDVINNQTVWTARESGSTSTPAVP